MYWDVLRLFHEIKQGLLKSRPYNIKSLGIDTWCVDFGLLDKDGKPVSYTHLDVYKRQGVSSISIR